jgi:hypothetical protein
MANISPYFFKCTCLEHIECSIITLIVFEMYNAEVAELVDAHG